MLWVGGHILLAQSYEAGLRPPYDLVHDAEHLRLLATHFPTELDEVPVKLLDAIGDLPLGNSSGNFADNSIDLFGDAYEYLMGMYAANAGSQVRGVATTTRTNPSSAAIFRCAGTRCTTVSPRRSSGSTEPP